MSDKNLPQTTKDNNGAENNSKLIKSSLKEIAKLCQKDKDISSALSDGTIDNMKAFLIVYARSQLSRVIKLTDALGNLEDRLIEQSLDPSNVMDPYTMMNVIRVIQNSLNQAMNMIQKVTSDESFINVIINNTKTVNNTFNQYNNNSTPILLSQDSREKVKNIAEQIISGINKMDSTNKETKEIEVVEAGDIKEVVEEEE